MNIPLISYSDVYDKDDLFLMLVNRFYGLCDAIELHFNIRITVDKELSFLKQQYIYDNRFYHDIRHIMSTLELFDVIKHDIPEVYRRIAMQFSLIYHDSIYDSTKPDEFNIKRSIRSVLDAVSPTRTDEMLGFTDLLETYISATNHFQLIEDDTHRNNMTSEEKYISDIDLYSLSIDESIFKKNNENIRKEFSNLNDVEFYSGQRQFLRKILNLNKIYLTDFFGNFEADARRNITNHLDSL
jgi:predicted metal-dependent HD superfamily phosphohydrolase